MGKITILNQKSAIIDFHDCSIRVYTKYDGPYCTTIRVWKLPPRGSFWNMLNTNNLIWAIYGDDAKFVHGWFFKLSKEWLTEFVYGIAGCKNTDDVREFLTNLDGLISGDTSAMIRLAIEE